MVKFEHPIPKFSQILSQLSEHHNSRHHDFYTSVREVHDEVNRIGGNVIPFELMVRIASLRLSPIVFTSMPADPIHIGHTRLLLESAEIAKKKNAVFMVIVNDDEFLKRKKGRVFMPLAERIEIVAAIRGVDYVAPWSSPTQFVDKAILAIRPTYFTKGGDRSSPAQIAKEELEACQHVGCEIVYGVGGFEKVQSSSSLVKNAALERL